jgi:hypothetical protein
MLRNQLARAGGLLMIVAVLCLASLTTSCGSGSGIAAKDMALVEFLFVDRALNPTAPTGTVSLPRNAQILLVFSELVDPASVDNQTIQIRFGDTGQSVPTGSFSVDGNTVRFDPTVTNQGQPNPFGFEPVTQFNVDIPNWEEQPDVVRNLDNDPNLVTFFTQFVTSDDFLRELDPPTVEEIFFLPDPFEVNPLTGDIPGNGIMGIRFSEAMDPGSFVLGATDGVDPGITSVDVRYLGSVQINIDNGLVNPSGIGKSIPGFFTRNAAADTYFFNPTFSFGDKKYVFAVRVFQGVKDLSGNLLINPRSFPGPDGYTTDGNGSATGFFLEETFDSFADVDFSATDADWGVGEGGSLQGAPITSRNAYTFGYTFHLSGAWGTYSAVTDPLIGAALNTVPGIPTPSPPTSPDSNATFAAIYPEIFLRMGHQKSASMTLSPSFSGNYQGNPTIVYTGSYSVTQAANVGNTTGHPPGGCTGCSPLLCPDHYNQGTYQTFFPCNPNNIPAPLTGCPYNINLFFYTGFFSWPSFTTFFEWTEGDPTVAGDSVFLFDASVREGDTWQQIRTWFGTLQPCQGALIGGFPGRRLYATFEEDVPNPTTNALAFIFNPEPSVTDTCFTITKRTSVAQTLFYTDGFQPTNSSQTTFTGKTNDFFPALVNPSVQTGGTQAVIQYQAADAVDFDRRTINAAAPFLADWTEDANDCDGFNNIRWRMILTSNLISNQRPKIFDVALPYVMAGP